MSQHPPVYRTKHKVCVEEVTLKGKDVEQCYRFDEFDCAGLSNSQIVRKAKKMFGWTGIRCHRVDDGYYLTLKAYGSKCALVLHKKVTY